MTLLLLRHGESEGNVQRRIQGWLDYPLTPIGWEQAAASGRFLAGREAVALYSSPLRRARETADRVAEHTGHEVIDLPDLREYRFGEAQGLLWDEARERWGLVGRDWGSGRIPGEEGVTAFRTRVARQVEELLARHADDVAICVVHGGVLGAVVATLCGLADREYAQIYTANCGVTTISSGADGRASIEVLNEVCHLRALGEIEKEPWVSG